MILEQQELKELSELQRLIEAGLERGSLSTGEIVEVLAELEIEVEQIEELYRELESQGIEIIETPAVVEEKVAAPQRLVIEGTTDSLQLFLQEVAAIRC
jgi:hypothetical protein